MDLFAYIDTGYSSEQQFMPVEIFRKKWIEDFSVIQTQLPAVYPGTMIYREREKTSLEQGLTFVENLLPNIRLGAFQNFVVTPADAIKVDPGFQAVNQLVQGNLVPAILAPVQVVREALRGPEVAIPVIVDVARNVLNPFAPVALLGSFF